ncbi:tondu-domain-containing Growth Inhibitor isoform X2 [Musca autumnalis]|uniref:tondu-domain-containing Growth Inhibitor isoform X2 n=1 Tax=Musca autumnalis TaxID=221902 RepID=UPI003CE88762
MESALDVLSRAATMVQQDNANEARLTSKELPTTAWRRERRLRTGEYHHAPSQLQQQQHHHQHHHHHLASPAGSSASSARGVSPSSSPPPPHPSIVHGQSSPSNSTVTTTSTSATHLHSNAHQISMMMAAAAAVGMRPLCETTSRPSPPPVASHGNMHMARPETLNEADMDDAPLDMSVSSSLKQRNSPPPPYREPLPGSQYISTLPRPSVITQAPPKRDARDSALLANRENDNRSSESIDEHFRRSLGNDYFALFAKKSPASQSTKTPSPQPGQQPPAAHARTPPPPASALQHSQSAVAVPPPAYPNILTPAHQQQTNSVLLSPAAIMAAHMKGATADHMAGTNSPPLQLVVRAPLQQQQQPLALQRATSVTSQTPLPSPQSPTIKVAATQSPISSTAGSRTASPLPLNQPASQQSSAITLSRFTSVENSPASSPGQTQPVVTTNVALPNASPTLPAIMRIKTEPGLQSIKANNNPTPPASPTSTTNPNILMAANNNNNIVSSSSSPSSPAPSTASSVTIKSTSTTTGGNSSADVLASVDDHFAKALGDTWKRLQESKEMRK